MPTWLSAGCVHITCVRFFILLRIINLIVPVMEEFSALRMEGVGRAAANAAAANSAGAERERYQGNLVCFGADDVGAARLPRCVRLRLRDETY